MGPRLDSRGDVLVSTLAAGLNTILEWGHDWIVVETEDLERAGPPSRHT